MTPNDGGALAAAEIDSAPIMTGDEIKAWREAQKPRVSQSKLAELLPAPIKTLQNWEQGRVPAPDYLRRALRDIERDGKKGGGK